MYLAYKDTNILFKILPCLLITIFFVLIMSSYSFGATFDFTFNESEYSLNLDDEITIFKYMVFTYYVDGSYPYYHRGEFFVSDEPITFTRQPTESIPNYTFVTSSGALYHYNFTVSSSTSYRKFSVIQSSLESMTFSKFSRVGGLGSSFLHPSYIYGSNESIYSVDGELEFEVIDDQSKTVNDLLGGSGSISDITNSISSSDWATSLEEEDKSSITEAPQKIGGAFDNIFGMFSFVDNIKSSVLTIYNIINSTDVAPRFSINIDSDYLKGDCIVVDLSWYAPYKNYGDNVICMFFYLGFIWHVFTKLSSIINGVDSSYSTVNDTSRFLTNSDRGNKK